MRYGDDFFLKNWLKESEFQRMNLRQQAIKDRIYQGNSELIEIKVYAGMPVYFNAMARNEDNYDQTYKVELYDQNLALGTDQPDPKTLPVQIIMEDRTQDMLEKRGLLAKDGAVKCADLKVFTRLKDGKLLLTLGPRKCSNFLVKYLSVDALPKTYLIRLTKLVDKYDLGHSFQIKVNSDLTPPVGAMAASN